VSGELEPVRCGEPEDEDNERPRHPRQQALPDEQHGQCNDTYRCRQQIDLVDVAYE
jgi:hypothetical protein